MGYVVYVDVLFFVNVFVDYILLWEFGKAAKKKKRICRLIAGSILGGVGAVLKCFQIPVPYILILCFMILIAYPGTTRGEKVFCIIYFYLFNIMTGGIIYYLREQQLFINKGWQLILVIYALCIGMTKGAGYFYEKAVSVRHQYPVQILLEGEKIEGMGLLDTGNQLYDPFFHRPVMLGEYGLVKELYERQKDTLLWIPYHSIGKDHGMLPAIKIENLGIQINNQWVYKKNVLMGVKQGKLSAKNQYQFILHEKILWEE